MVKQIQFKKEKYLQDEAKADEIKKIHKAGAEAALYMIHAYVEPHENTNPKMIRTY